MSRYFRHTLAFTLSLLLQSALPQTCTDGTDSPKPPSSSDWQFPKGKGLGCMYTSFSVPAQCCEDR